ncbi:cell wall hydrolase [Bartonella sp. DGB2]|uniref:cell wall hydrolase n=1 Tax=Bartonella sp. DGB2 TaxID=3388426 RepID=UPI00398F9D24
MLLTMGGCSLKSNSGSLGAGEVPAIKHYPLTERQCLARAMYFESNRSSPEGMIAVGTVVMNRVHSTAFPSTICAVVGQKRQFAPGVLTRPMQEPKSKALAEAMADKVLSGARDRKSRNAMFFHTAGYSFPYKNMHYVNIAGGNAFYEKRNAAGALTVPVNDQSYDVALAFAQEGKEAAQFQDAIIANDSSAERRSMSIANVPKPTSKPRLVDNRLLVQEAARPSSNVARGRVETASLSLDKIGHLIQQTGWINY